MDSAHLVTVLVSDCPIIAAERYVLVIAVKLFVKLLVEILSSVHVVDHIRREVVLLEFLNSLLP